jgi:hypothetical protein
VIPRARLEGPGAVLLIFLVALAVRLAYATAHPAGPLAGDALGYHEYAAALLGPGRFENAAGERATRGPGYPAFLALIYSAAGPSARAVQYAQCLLGALTCLACLRLAAAFLPGPWPALCGLAAALYFGMYSTPASVLTECLYGLFLVLALLALCRPSRGGGGSAGGLAGAAACGLLFLTGASVRPEGVALGLAALASAPAAWKPGPGLRRTAAAALVLLLGVALWAERNRRVLGAPLPATSQGAKNLYAGLHLPLYGRGIVQEPFFEPSASLGELDKDKAYRAEFERLRSGLSPDRMAQAYALDLLAHFYPFLPEYDAGFVLLLPLWVYALWLALRRPELRPLAAAILVSIGLYTVFGGPVSRYRQSYAPVAVVLAAVGAQRLWEIHGARLRGPALAWTGANFLVWLAAGQARRLALAVRDALF